MSLDGIRISDLETFAGAVSGDDYLVIEDNGQNTKKISAQALLGNVDGNNVISFADPDSDGNIVITIL